MKRAFETAECEEVWNSIFLVQRYEKLENQMKGCAMELKVSDWQMLGIYFSGKQRLQMLLITCFGER